MDARARTASTRKRKIFALASAGIVLGIGATATLAAWNDNEWVVGGLDGGGDGIGTSRFNVQQNTLLPTADVTDFVAAWDDHETQSDAGVLLFSLGALALTPGTTVYAPVALQTEANSIAGTVTLQGAVKPTTTASPDLDAPLWDTLTYSVRSSTTAADCTDAASFAAFPAVTVADGTALGSALTAPEHALAAAAGSTQYYCFAITLPDSPEAQETQGMSVAPAWRFAAESA
ncbi:SipW-dependent-type signal peptide-containing protein [Mycetocola sp. 2940]|uniref:SipW-dependent-type signal peptide-containing protein n=1 Tax=Mycetocola sp. 2940 TaxID=3156452 RepID=UPI0033992890